MPSGSGPHSALDETELRAALFAVGHFCSSAPSVPPSMWHLRERLDAAVRATSALSASGHEMRCDGGLLKYELELIDTAAASKILGCTGRTVRRLAADLDGQRPAGRWVYDAAKVREYAAAKQEGKNSV